MSVENDAMTETARDRLPSVARPSLPDSGTSSSGTGASHGITAPPRCRRLKSSAIAVITAASIWGSVRPPCGELRRRIVAGHVRPKFRSARFAPFLLEAAVVNQCASLVWLVLCSKAYHFRLRAAALRAGRARRNVSHGFPQLPAVPNGYAISALGGSVPLERAAL